MGRGPHGPRRRDLHALDRHRRAHAVQSGDRRNGEGPPRSRDRRARRSDGARDRRDGHPVQAAQSQPRPGGLVATRAGRQARLRRVGSRGALGGAEHLVDHRARRSDSRRRTAVSAVSRSRTATPIAAMRWSSPPARFSTGWFTSGRCSRPSGRADEPPSRDLAESLKSFGFRWGRLKTGTPPRLHRRSIDFSRFVEERGDDPPVPFSFKTRDRTGPRSPATSFTRPSASTSSFAITSANRRSTTARFLASVRVTARRSKTR